MKFATNQSVANFRALNARRPPSAFFFFLLLSFFSPSSLLLRSQRRRRVSPHRSRPPEAAISAPLHPRSLLIGVRALWSQAGKLGREPTSIEVFKYIHTKDHNLKTFIDRRAVSVNENYTTARERLVSAQADESKAKSRIDEVALYLEAVAGEKKRKIYGIGSQASQFYCGSASHTSGASVGPQPEHSAEEFTALWAHVDDQQRQIAELRAHVMRLVGQPGADDTLVTPPGTTAHPAGTPSGDLTLDRAADQPRRFDFGPF
ncbi:hypothetical protein JCGZ_26587 [Jatropha curcas]|uniref:Uncharacterized protein n=1 Tax=Jatropha curcas TaxID=180498 RepID=A0A067LGN4_JATCU|nr:hypothetical protein JCGZ_26587 [Jatropha curcas]